MNTKYWQVFEDDMQIKRFLKLSGEFVNTQTEKESVDSKNFQDIDEDEEGVVETEKLKGSLGGKDIVQLKSNHIPIGLIPLENIFYQNHVVRDPKVKPVENVVEDKNIGTEENPKIRKLSKKLSAKEKDEYVNLMKKYTDVFAWSYNDLKEYDTSIIQHTIPINPGEKPFWMKLRRNNPMLLPIIEKKIKKII